MTLSPATPRVIAETPRRTRWIAVLFAFSGMSALVYQVAWQRLLALQSGVGIYSISLIVAAFLGGLGLGSYAGGLASRRLTPGRALTLFCWIEIGIGLVGLLSPLVYYHGFSRVPSSWFSNPWAAGVLHVLGLLPPTLLMGMSFPVLVRATCQAGRISPSGISWLYGLNTVGAGVGALLTPWLLLHRWGIEGAIHRAAALNLAVGFGTFLLRRVLLPGETGSARAERLPAGAPPPALPWLWLFLYGVSGWAGIGLEILWFRTLDTALKATAFTFGSLLGLYLVCLGLGSVTGGALSRRVRDPLRAFLACQGAALVYAALSFLLLARIAPDTPLYNDLFLYWQQLRKVLTPLDGNARIFTLLYLVLPLALFGPVTFLQGVSFACLQKAVQRDPEQAGHRAGLLQAVNILGCVLGSLAIGLWALDHLGTTGAMRLVTLSGLVFAAVGLARPGARLLGAGLAAGLLATAVLIPSQHAFWSRLHGETTGRMRLAEDATGLVALIPSVNFKGDPNFQLRLGGKLHSMLPYYGTHSRLGALAALLHPDPRRVAVIGLASGETAFAAGVRGQTESMRVFEICRPQLAVLRHVSTLPGHRSLRRLLADERLELVFADGRLALAASTNLYDVIVTDAPPPQDAYSALLFSVEYHALCRSRLAPGGLVCAWTPTEQTRASFRRIFPNCMAFPGAGESHRPPVVLVGAVDPIPPRAAEWLARLADVGPSADLPAGIRDDLRTALADGYPLQGPVSGPVITDLFPVNEFAYPCL